MYRALGAAALLSIAIAAPAQDAVAQDPVGGAILGGAAGAILGGALDGGRGAAIGAIVGGPLALPLLRRANRALAATVTTSVLVISNVATGRGSWLHRTIARRRLPPRSRLLPNHALG
jgi:hypothetical protein